MRLAAKALGCALLLLGCGEERHVRVVVDLADGVDDPISRVGALVQLTSTGDEDPVQKEATLPEGGARRISFPADFVVLIGEASGHLSVVVTGRDADDATIASGAASGEVSPGGSGEVATVHVTLDRGGPGAGSCRDGVATVGEICYGPALAHTAQPGGTPAAADVDGDGIVDLVTVVGGDDPGRGLSVSRGRGNDVFEPPRSVLGPSVPGAGERTVALGDVDGDGLVDAVIASASDQAPLVSHGRAEDPWFGLIAPIPNAGAAPAGLAPQLADLDGDGDLDVVARGTSSVWVGIGAGDGTFAAHTVSGLDGAEHAVPGELDGDAGLEIAVALGGDVMRVIDADGTTVAEGTLGGTGNWFATIVADVDGTAPAEIVVSMGPEIRVARVDGTNIVVSSILSATPGRAVGLAPAWDADGTPAVIAAVDDERSNGEYLPSATWLAGGTGRDLTVTTRERVHCYNGRLASADLDGDGDSEALFGCGGAGIAVVRRVDGVFQAPRKGPDTTEMVVGDIDGDRRPDVVMSWWSLSLMRRADDPEAASSVEDVPESPGNTSFAKFGDFTGDGRDDLVAACTEVQDWCPDGALKRWTANVGGAIEVLPPVRLPAIATSVTLARTVPDAKLRIIVTVEGGQLLSIDGETGETETTAQGAPGSIRFAGAGPLDEAPGDEVVLLGDGGDTVVFRSVGNGALSDPVRIGRTAEASGLGIGDVDSDGSGEVVITENMSTSIQVLTLTDTGAEEDGSFSAGVEAEAAAVIDLDGDGVPEIVIGGSGGIEVWSLVGAPTLRRVMTGLDSYGAPFAAFSPSEPGDEWVPPILFGLGRWDIAGDNSWMQYVMSWLPSP